MSAGLETCDTADLEVCGTTSAIEHLAAKDVTSRMNKLVSAVLGVCAISLLAPAEKLQDSETLTLQYISAPAAVDRAVGRFGDFVGRAIVAVDEKRNTISLAGGEEVKGKLLEFLHSIDKRPDQVRIAAVFTKVSRDATGREVRNVIAKPTVFCAEGKTATLSIGDDNGALVVDVTTTIVPGD
ncbi:MAG: hypothetical protein ACR2OZ_00330 [Verrucomicrobiales bacterium]